MNHPIPCAVERDLAAYERPQADLDVLDAEVEDEARNLVTGGAFLFMKWFEGCSEVEFSDACDKLAFVFAARTDREVLERVRELKAYFMTNSVTESEALKRVLRREAEAAVWGDQDD